MEQGAGAIEQSANNGAEFLLVSTNIILFRKCEEVTDDDKIAVTGMSMANKASILRDPNVWIADTGATRDSTFDDSGMKGIEDTKKKITMGKGKPVSSSKMGDLKVKVHNKFGEELFNARMQKVAHVPEVNFNLFSLTQRMKQGWELGRNDESIWLDKGKKRITFNIVIPTPKGAIYCAYLCRQGSEVAATSQVQKKISVNLAHELFAHGDESSTRETAEALGFEVTCGTLKPCKACAAAKAKQKNLPTHGEHIPSKENNEKIFLDLSTVKAPKELKMTVTKPN